MLKDKRALAAVIPLAVAGCWAQPGPLASTVDFRNVALGEQKIDLSGGRAPAAGYGKLTLRVPIKASPRSVQATANKLVVVVTKKDGSQVTDENVKHAVYSADVGGGGTATVTLPGLPATTTDTSGGMDPATAYVITTLMGNWEGTDVPTLPGATGYTLLTTANGTWGGYGSIASSIVTFNLGKDLVDYNRTGTTVLPTKYLIASGYGRADVSPGLASTVTISSYVHTQSRILANANTLDFGDFTGLTSGLGSEAASASVYTTIKSDSSGNLSMRLPGVNTADFPFYRTGGNPTAQRPLRIVASTNAGAAIGTPTLAVTEWSQVGDVSTIRAAAAMDATLAAGSNPAFSLGGKMAWADIDLASTNAGKRQIDLSFTGLPTSTDIRIYTIPMGANYITAGETDAAGNKFN